MNSKVYSMSAIHTFKRCPKQFQIKYKWLLDGTKESPALAYGTSFHKLMQQRAKGIEWDRTAVDPAVLDVAQTFLEYNSFPTNIVSADDPYYINVEGTWIRITPDLVYLRNDVYVIRDWKTFEKWPSNDADLDFQAHVYLALMQKHFGKKHYVEFEHVYVRKTPPYVPKDKAGNSWLPGECYRTDPLIPSQVELDKAYAELVFDLQMMQQADKASTYTRTALKGGGYMDCERCSVKEICKADKVTPPGEQPNLYGIAIPREEEKVPDDILLRGGR